MLVAPPSLPPPGRAVAMPPPLTASIRHEVSASALSVDATGAFAVLAGRRGLHVVDLEAPHAPVVAAFHQPSKWEVAVAKCSPHAQFRGHVASTSNRYTLIWNISYAPAAGDLDAMSDPGAGTPAGTSAGAAYSTTPPASVGRGAHLSPDAHVNSPTTSSNNAVVATLRAHTRTVSDLSWSLSDPMLLATCSADTKTHLWDLRAPQRPVQTLATYTASAVQVEWNRVDPFTLATAHDGEVRVWDTRASRDNKPLVLVTAHMQKIYGLDWHPQRAQELLTCSEDKTVKVWDISQPRACQGSLTTSAPVWRARYTPFGDGIVTISQRLDFSLRLWSISRAATDLSASAAGAMESGIDPSAPSPSVNGAAPSGGNTAAVRIDPVHTFAGHHDLVKGMAWRAYPTSGNGGDTGTGYQLVSWSKDQELRLWRMEPQQLQACGYDGLPGSYSINPRGADEQRDIKRSGTRADVLHMYSSSKYDVSALKADFVPLVVPKTAVPLGPSEYFLEENNSSLQALLALEEDLIKGESGDSSDSGPESSSEEDRDEYEESGENKYSTDVKVSRRKKRSTSDMSTGDIILGKEKTQAGQANRAAAALPCPRFSGACFSGPNMLVIFDSRVAIGQSRSSVVTSAATAAGKGKAPAPPIKVPRTYDELLDMRDDRFASKKNKKPPVKLLTSAAKSMLGAMDLASEWGQYDMDSSTIGYSDTDGDAATSRLHHQFNGGGGLFFSSSSSLLPSTDGGNDIESTIHGGSEYLKTYFANSEYHLPVNHPDHRISVPTSSIPGAALSPRASTVRSSLTAGSGGGSALTGPKRIDQSTPVPPALNLDLSLSVTILDLSKLCGVSSILTYKTDVAPRYLLKQEDEEEYAVNQQQLDRKKKQRVKNAKKRSFALLSWMLEASKQVTPAYTDGHSNALILSRGGKHRHSTTTTKHMSHILRSLLSKKHNSKTSNDPSNGTPGASGSAVTSAEDDDDDDTVSLTCAENARIAAMAGRSDLQQVWKLLEISTAPAVRLPIFDNPGKDSVHLATDHPWSAHPFGKRLVTRVLNMYEQAGDVHALASIVCALKPHDNSASHIDDIAQSELMSSRLDGEPSGAALLDGPDNGNPLKKSASSMTILQSGTPPDLGELPPVMKSVRRSSSHNDGRPTTDNSSSSFVAATPSGSSSSVTSSPHRPVSPIRDRDGIARDKSEASGWKMDFEKIENPFKTWSGGSIKEAPPRPLSDDMFRSPSAPGKPSATPLISPHLRPILEPNAHVAVADVNAREVVSLSLTQRTLADDRCLLSSDIEDEMRYDAYKQSYAEVLYRYGAMNLRNDVLKTVSRVREEPEGITVGLICGTCGTHTSSPLCSNCHDFAVKCSVCQLVVRGQSMFCMACGHGGHVNHLREWFEFENACPTGCGCWCKQATATMPVLDAEETEMSRDQVAPSRSFSF